MMEYELTDEEMRSLYQKWDVEWNRGETGLPWWETLAKAQRKKLLVWLGERCGCYTDSGGKLLRRECCDCWQSLLKERETPPGSTSFAEVE